MGAEGNNARGHQPLVNHTHPPTLSNHPLGPKVNLKVLFGHVFGTGRELHKGIDTGLALCLAGFGLFHDPEWGKEWGKEGGKEGDKCAERVS